MKLSTGKVAFPIEFDNGDKQTIYFNPNDPNLMVRIKNIESNMFEKIQEIENIELTNEGKPTHISDIEIFDKFQNAFKEELDIAFGGSISEIAFKHCSPFAIVGGEFFVVQFLNALLPEIEKHITKARAEAESRMNKHIGKYKV